MVYGNMIMNIFVYLHRLVKKMLDFTLEVDY